VDTAAAQEEVKPQAEPKKDEPKKDEPKVVAATKGPFTVSLDLAGVLDAKKQWDVEVDAESWGGDMEVIEAAPSGVVTKDQVLVRFKTDKIDEAIAAAERDFGIARANFQKQQDDAKRAEDSAALAMLKAKLDLDAAETNWTRWQEYERDFRLKDQDLRLQSQRDSIADAKEELDQLEKMYKADEITEETEEIVLKRSRRDFERRKISLAMFEKRDAAWRATDFPRDQVNAEVAIKKARIDFERAKLATDTGLESGRLEFEKAKTAFGKQEENLGKLRRDRELFVVKAPAAGYAVRGSLSRGKWAGTEEPSATLKPESKVKPHATLFTIVEPGAVYVRSSVPEGSVFSVAEGQNAVVTPNAATKLQLAAKVARVGKVPAGAEFEVFFDLTTSDPRLMPGHTAKIKLTTVEKDGAITVPATAVEKGAEKGADKDSEKRFVHVVAGESKPERREVEVGESSGGRTEILKGLSEGDRVLETAPKQK
jgi:multidrug resistance efflux pump